MDLREVRRQGQGQDMQDMQDEQMRILYGQKKRKEEKNGRDGQQQSPVLRMASSRRVALRGGARGAAFTGII